MPAHTRTVFDDDTLKLAMDQSNCPGFKDSGGDLAFFEATIHLRNRHRPDWKVYVGPEHLTAATIDLGGDGGVNGGANVIPELFTSLFASTTDRLALQDRVVKFGRIYMLAEGESAVVRGLKAALAAIGICTNRCAEPWEGLLVDSRVRDILAEVGINNEY
jgi:4-hydroxy-tetrahydrodipicolinate synthase